MRRQPDRSHFHTPNPRIRDGSGSGMGEKWDSCDELFTASGLIPALPAGVKLSLGAMRENASGIHFPDYPWDLRAAEVFLGFFFSCSFPQPLPFPLRLRTEKLGGGRKNREADPGNLSGMMEMRERILAE